MMKLVLLDGYSLLYRAYHALSTPMNAPDGTPTNAIHGFLMMLCRIMEEEKPDYMGVAFDAHAKTFRAEMYAAYKAGYLGNNILDTYFSFIANMIAEEKLTVVEDTVIASKFKDRYTIDLPLPFVRQVLGVGVQNMSFIEKISQKYQIVRHIFC